ncbi:hypothetical protein C8R26_10889 [Nitrosomonas oligotropha]|uniref:Uncharacterized protein n=1 Tax=Nitrosomonas oligotropha TaxID=42354 RepID=A0A2T5I0W4_9PROT|nr:hypothetical protein [Nitrosomonas oligotropha]PTQ77443.1 hypothetical protein C8R26_10889 [Nitrosomonas oligotropha]
MHKLSDYIKLAADTYFEETGSSELNAHWVAEFFQDHGLQDIYPSQSLVNFANLVQKELTRNEEQAAKKTRLHLDRIINSIAK